MTRVFVYGSLREGECSHDLLHDATKVTDTRLPGYDLYKVAWYPGIKPNPDNRDGVVGEVYEFSDERTLDTLDCYEGYTGRPESSLFVRNTVTLDGHETYVYEYNRSTDFKFCEPIPSGDWKKCE